MLAGRERDESACPFSFFFLFSPCVKNSVCFTERPPAGQKESPRHQTAQYENIHIWLQDTAGVFHFKRIYRGKNIKQSTHAALKL